MKSFDLRPAFKEKPAQGQQVLGGHNSANNCVPDSCLECYQALTGKWPCNPQDITSAVYGPGYLGGETFTPVIGFMRKRKDLFPDLPDIEVHDFGSKVPMDLIGEIGAAGFPMVASFYCDANGVILPYWSAILHASCPVASDGSSIWVWNVEGYEVRFSLADFARAYQGALVVFKRSVNSQEEDMLFRSSEKGPDGQPKVYVVDASGKRHLGGPEYTARVAGGAKVVDINAADLAAIPDAGSGGGAHTGSVSGTLTIS